MASMPNVTGGAGGRRRAVGRVRSVEDTCPICGGDDTGCLYGDWYLGDDETTDDSLAAA
jgi:hypothetical protein